MYYNLLPVLDITETSWARHALLMDAREWLKDGVLKQGMCISGQFSAHASLVSIQWVINNGWAERRDNGLYYLTEKGCNWLLMELI